MEKHCKTCSAYNDGEGLICCENCRFYSLWVEENKKE